jgi:hypothetical protein
MISPVAKGSLQINIISLVIITTIRNYSISFKISYLSKGGMMQAPENMIFAKSSISHACNTPSFTGLFSFLASTVFFI